MRNGMRHSRLFVLHCLCIHLEEAENEEVSHISSSWKRMCFPLIRYHKTNSHGFNTKEREKNQRYPQHAHSAIGESLEFNSFPFRETVKNTFQSNHFWEFSKLSFSKLLLT